MKPAKGIRVLILLAAWAMAFVPAASAAPYEYGLELVKMLDSSVITAMDFEDAATRNACFCVSDMDGDGWLEFTVAAMDDTKMYLDYKCYEYASEGEDVLSPVQIRDPESGLRPRLMGMPGENVLTAYRVIDENNREERYYHVDTTYRKTNIPWLGEREYLTARQIVDLSNRMLFTYLAAKELGVITDSKTQPGMMTFTPEKYMDRDGMEVDREYFEQSADTYIRNAEKTEATFLWIPVRELQKAIGLGRDETWDVLQKSWQGFRFGDKPQGQDLTGDRSRKVY